MVYHFEEEAKIFSQAVMIDCKRYGQLFQKLYFSSSLPLLLIWVLCVERLTNEPTWPDKQRQQEADESILKYGENSDA